MAAHSFRRIGALALLVLVATAAAQPAPAPASATHATGDPWLDQALIDMDRYAARYPDAFADEMSRYHATPRSLVQALLGPRHWSAGDIYAACGLAQVAGQPCRAVVGMRAQDPSTSWDAIAQALGVAPGSPAFERLKRGVVASYRHWARPLPLDASSPGGTVAPSSRRQP